MAMTSTPGIRLIAIRENRERRREAVLWMLAAVVAVGIVVPGAVVAPDVTMIALGGAVALFAAFRWPFVIAFTTLGVLVASGALELILGSVGGSLDELLILLCVFAFPVRRVWVHRAIVIPAGTWWIAGFFLVGAAASLLHDVPTELWAQQAFLTLKGVLLAFAFAQLEWMRLPLRRLLVGGAVTAFVLMGTALMNLFFTNLWVAFTKIRWPATVFGLPALNGPYSQPAALSRMAAIIAVSALCYLFVSRSRVIPWIITGGLALIAVLTVRVKTIVSLLVVFLLYGLRARSTWLILLVVAVAPIAAVTAVPLFSDLISTDVQAYFLGSTESARTRLLVGSLEIAQRDFPLGAGFGRYGTYMASVEYSPEYVARGWTWFYGLGKAEDWGDYLTDTQWPAFLGETGWLGTVLFAAGLIAIAVSFARPIAPLEPPLYRWIRWSGLAWLLVITIESVAAPVFTSPPAFAFAFLGAGIVASLRYQVARWNGTIPLAEYE